MNFSDIDHVTLVITDAERAVKFYRDILGLQEVSSPSTFPSAGLQVRWFRVGDQFVHLYLTGQADAPSPRHLALHVEDAQGARKELTRKGVSIRETVPIPGADRFFIADPDGNRIEIIQWFQRSEIAPLQ